MNKTSFHLPARSLFPVLALLALGVTSLWAENVFVTAFKGTTANSSDNSFCPPSCTSGSVSATGSSASSSASPTPVISASERRARFGFAAGCTWSVTPTDITMVPATGIPPAGYTFTALQNLGTYKIYYTKGTSGSGSADMVVNMTATGGDLADASGALATSVPLTCFQASAPNNTWIHIGYITNNTLSPTITFTHASGAISATARMYLDAIWFEYFGPCTGVAPEVKAEGPLAQGQTYVNVSGVAAGATNVTVYADTVEIGATNWAAGFAAGVVQVPVSALVKGTTIKAIQKKANATGGACSSDPGAGGLVGGGPNARLTTYLGCWKNSTNAGPIGANSSAPPGNVYPYFLKSSGVIANYGSAFSGGPELTPSECWQMISFQNGLDDATDLNDNSHVTNTDAFCSLESLAFSIVDADTGPYDIYVDSIMNGDTMIEDFESYAVDTTNTFATPYAASVPIAPNHYLSAPNSSTISANHAFDGTKSCRIQWQWSTEGNIRWARTIANAATGKRYPQLDTKKPITIRYLVLPVGSTVDRKFNGTVGAITNGSPAWTTGVNIIGPPVTGPGPYTYQWSWSGGPLYNNTTARTYTVDANDGSANGMSAANSGTYTVVVSDGTCSETRSVTMTVADPIPTITNQPVDSIILAGSTATALSVGADGHVPAGTPLLYQWRKAGVDILGQTTANLSFPSGAAISDAGSYDVVVTNNYGAVTSSVVALSVTTVAPGIGTGLRGDYRTLHYPTNAFSGTNKLSRIDPVVNFDWGTAGSPDPSISANYFTVRWNGQVQALGTDTYTISTVSDDGVRLWVNGQLLVNQWIDHAPWTNSANIVLTGTTKYDVTMEFFETASGAVAKLLWSTASGSIPPYTVVPQSQLFPAAAGTVIPPFTFTKLDATHLQFNWGVGTYNLAWATNVTGPYTNLIYGVTSPYTNTIGPEPTKFFRLKVE